MVKGWEEAERFHCAWSGGGRDVLLGQCFASMQRRRAGQIAVGSGLSPPLVGLRALAVDVAALLPWRAPADQTMQGPRALLRGVAAAARAVGAQVKGGNEGRRLGWRTRVPVCRAELVGAGRRPTGGAGPARDARNGCSCCCCLIFAHTAEKRSGEERTKEPRKLYSISIVA